MPIHPRHFGCRCGGSHQYALNASVASGVADIADRIGQDYLRKAKELKLHDMRFEEYVDVLSESMPSMMRRAATDTTEVRAWIERVYISSTFHRNGYAAPRA